MIVASLLGLASVPSLLKGCANPDHAHLSDLSISPDPPLHGEPVNLKITATPDIAVTAGSVAVDVTVFGLPVPGTPTYDLCKDVGVTCPLAPGKSVSASVQYGVSPHVPTGIDATIKLVIKDGQGAELGCASFEIKVSDDEKASEAVESTGRVTSSTASYVTSSSTSRKLGAEPAAQRPPPVEAASAPSALIQLLSAPAAADEVQRHLLQSAYAEQPEWAGLFAAWQQQHKQGLLQQGKPAYSSPIEEARRFGAFKATVLRLQGAKGTQPPAVADQHADKTPDEMRTLAHFA